MKKLSLVLKRKLKIMKLRSLLDKINIITEEIDEHHNMIRLLNKQLHRAEKELEKVDKELEKVDKELGNLK